MKKLLLYFGKYLTTLFKNILNLIADVPPLNSVMGLVVI